jgi:dihydrofolate synthase / folylpolyglutamate synthase
VTQSQDRTGYEAALAALEQRWPDSRVVASLDRERMLVDLLGSPQHAYPVIQVTGTNGKSSTTRMIDGLVRATGLRVGRFTSPEFTQRERIAVDGVPVEPDEFARLYREVAGYLDLVDAKFPQRLTTFEVVTAMAFVAFADAPVDLAAVEVGVGGAWDSTNVADATVAVVTPIALDHQDLLGHTIEEIAAVKAGIVKSGATAVVAEQPREAVDPIAYRCAEVGAAVVAEGHDFGVLRRELAVGGQRLTLQGLGRVFDDVYLPLHGAHQAQNAGLALAAVEAFLGARGDRALDPELVREGFAGASSPGRLERIRSAPTMLLDAAHNPHGMAATVAAIREEFSFGRLVALVAVFADKDVPGLLDELEDLADQIVVTVNSSPRSMPVDELAAIARDLFGPERVSVAASMPDAIELAVALAESEPTAELASVGVLITGSVVTVADARRLLRR